jgi:ribosomal protein S8E
MKNGIFTLTLMVAFMFFTNVYSAQTTQASFAGSWRMKPLNSSHNLSKLNIIDNGTIVTINIKKLNLKNIPAKYDPQERKLHFNVSGTDYYLVYVPANGQLMGYTTGTGVKFGDYVK